MKTNSKLRSRTFWLAIVWTAFIPIAIISQVFIAKYDIQIPIGSIITGAATITTLYVGGNKGKQIATAAGAPKGESGKNNEDN